jgi:hypothetical protein
MLQGFQETRKLSEGEMYLTLVDIMRVPVLSIGVTTHLNDTILSVVGSPESDFSGGHPSWYYSCRSTLNYGVLIGSWPSWL